MSNQNHQAAIRCQDGSKTTGRVLRTKLFDKFSLLLSLSEQVRDSNVWLMLQAGCLDLVSVLEEVIEEEGLDEQFISRTH